MSQAAIQRCYQKIYLRNFEVVAMLLEFTAESGRYYCYLKTESFTIEEGCAKDIDLFPAGIQRSST